MVEQLTTQLILDALGHGVLIFNHDGELVQTNQTAEQILGPDLNIIRLEGWTVVEDLFDTGLEDEDRLSQVRKRALESETALRFHIFRSGEYLPCWASTIPDSDGTPHLMIVLDVPDWKIVTHILDTFRREMRDAITSTVGHIDLINRTIDSVNEPASMKLGKRLEGFTRLVAIHMSRAGRLMEMLERLEEIRTGRIRSIIQQERRAISLADFLEDFLEELDEIQLLDPESETHDYRARLQLELEPELTVDASRRYLRTTLQELIRNAIMYSLRGTPIRIRAFTVGRQIQFDVIDEGYGVRQKDYDRVFKPFARGQQPQVISEFGYGLALHLCRHEIEAMNGRMWFTSEEGIGTTVSFDLPLWIDSGSSSESGI